jgi:hypothetical protein
MITWLAQVFLLPSRIAHAFGFSGVIHIIDHYDASQFKIQSALSPFPLSKRVIYLSDVVKVALVNESFIMAAKDEHKFVAALPATSSELRINLDGKIDLHSLVGIMAPVDHSDKQFVVNLTDEPVPVVLEVGTCGGIPAYLAIWSELNEIVDLVEGEDDDLPILAKLHQLLQVFLFDSEAAARPLQISAWKRKVLNSS